MAELRLNPREAEIFQPECSMQLTGCRLESSGSFLKKKKKKNFPISQPSPHRTVESDSLGTGVQDTNSHKNAPRRFHPQSRIEDHCSGASYCQSLLVYFYRIQITCSHLLGGGLSCDFPSLQNMHTHVKSGQSRHRFFGCGGVGVGDKVYIM